MPYVCSGCRRLHYHLPAVCDCGDTDFTEISTQDYREQELERLRVIRQRAQKNLDNLSNFLDDLQGFIERSKENPL